MLNKAQYKEIFGIDFDQPLDYVLSLSNEVKQVRIDIPGNSITLTEAKSGAEDFDQLRLSPENFAQLQHYLVDTSGSKALKPFRD